MSNEFVKDIYDVSTVGDEVTVKVTPVGNDDKIGLSIRRAQEPAEGQQPKHEFQRCENNHKNRDRNPRAGGRKPFSKPQANNDNDKQDSDLLMNSLLKDSNDRLSPLERNTGSKHGGHGGHRD